MVTIDFLLLILLAAAKPTLSLQCTSYAQNQNRKRWEHRSLSLAAYQIQQNRYHIDCNRRGRIYDKSLVYKRQRSSIHKLAARIGEDTDEECEYVADCIDPSTLQSHTQDISRRTALPDNIDPSSNIQRIHSTSSAQDISRRTALLQLLSTSILLSSSSQPALASSEIDTTGELYSPKNIMIKQGGSAAARGIRLKSKQESQEVKDSRKKSLLNSSTGLIQNVYETRFITYLSRFLLSYDLAASAWWDKNSKSKGVVDNEEVVVDSYEIFAQFAESVEVGLADYFLGPYGSYASVAAAKAGVNAVMPAQSVRETDKSPSLFNILTTGNRGKGRKNSQTKKSTMSSIIAQRKSKNAQKEANKLAKQGILNLFSLLSARYTLCMGL